MDRPKHFPPLTKARIATRVAPGRRAGCDMKKPGVSDRGGGPLQSGHASPRTSRHGRDRRRSSSSSYRLRAWYSYSSSSHDGLPPSRGGRLGVAFVIAIPATSAMVTSFLQSIVLCQALHCRRRTAEPLDGARRAMPAGKRRPTRPPKGRSSVCNVIAILFVAAPRVSQGSRT